MAEDPDFEHDFRLVPFDRILNPFNPSTTQLFRMDFTDNITLSGKMVIWGKLPTVPCIVD